MQDGYDLPAEAPGQYRPLREDKPLPKAYFPDSLPPEFVVNNDLANAVADAMHALGRLDGLASEVDNPGAVFSSFVYKEAENSSQVEGTAVTVSDIYRHDVTDGGETPTSGHEQDVQEARNYVAALDDAMTYLRTAGFDRENITLQLIRQMHETLLEGGRSEEEDPLPGEFRPDLVTIDETNDLGQTRIRFPPPKPDVAERAMSELETYVQSSHAWPALVDIALIHYQFETVHPFRDGNGRVGRLLIVLLLVCTGLLRHPILYPSSYFRRRKDQYADHLLRVSEAGEWEGWIEFFLEGIREQATEAFVRARLLLRTRNEYDDQYADAPTSVRRLVAALFSDPYITVNEAADAIEMAYGTANNAVERLEEDGVLEEITGQEQYRVFRAAEIMDIVERPADELPDPDDVFGGSSSWNFL